MFISVEGIRVGLGTLPVISMRNMLEQGACWTKVKKVIHRMSSAHIMVKIKLPLPVVIYIICIAKWRIQIVYHRHFHTDL